MGQGVGDNNKLTMLIFSLSSWHDTNTSRFLDVARNRLALRCVRITQAFLLGVDFAEFLGICGGLILQRSITRCPKYNISPWCTPTGHHVRTYPMEHLIAYNMVRGAPWSILWKVQWDTMAHQGCAILVPRVSAVLETTGGSRNKCGFGHFVLAAVGNLIFRR